MKIPFMRIDRQYQALEADIMAAVRRVYSCGRVLQGAEIRNLEEAVKQKTGRAHAVAVGSCTDALYFSLKAAGLNSGDEVLVTSLSFIASASCIPRAGLKPVFTDIDPNYYMMDPAILDRWLTPRTRAIVAVNIFGQMMDMEALTSFAESNNLILIEDAAQAMGSHYKGKPAGSFGRASCLSFDPTKVVNAHATAGMFLTDDERMANTVAALRYHGKNSDTGGFEIIGNNSQMSSLQAALLSIKLAHMDKWQKNRIDIARRYTEGLSGLPGITPPEEAPNTTHVFHKYVIRMDDRDALKRYLAENGIGTAVHYPVLMPHQPCMNPFHPPAARFPHAEAAARTLLSLPIYPELSANEVDTIIESIVEFSQCSENTKMSSYA